MNIQSFLNSAFKASLDIMGAEDVTIGGSTFKATVDLTPSQNPLAVGGGTDERTITIQFPSDLYTGSLRSGMKVTVGGKQWKISAEDGAIERGRAATLVTLIEPNRRSNDY